MSTKNNPIRILHMIGSLNVGGSQSMVINLYKAIDRNKVQFDFIVDKPGELFYKDLVESLGAKVFYFPTFNGHNFLKIKKVWKNFFVQHPEYKILHSHIRSYASIYLPVAKKQGVKTIIHSHSTSNGKGIKSFLRNVFQYPLRYQSDFFMSCSIEAGEWLFGKKVVKSANHYILKNSINVAAYAFSMPKRKRARLDLGITDETVFIHVGRLSLPKNHSFLLQVFSRIYKKNPSSKLILVGDGELKDWINQEIRSLGLNDCVLALGNRNDVSNLLQAADCFLFPSKWEGLPVTVVEAQASGLPTYISDKITDEVVVSELVKKLPIDSGVDCWVDAIFNDELTRKDVSKDIINAGFDTCSTSDWLMQFYYKIITKDKE